MTLFRWPAFLSLALLAASAPAAGADGGISPGSAPAAGVRDVLPLLPAETEQIVYVNIEQFIRSEFSKKHLAQPLAALVTEASVKELVSLTGIDPLKDLRLLVLAGALPLPGEALPSHALFVLTGNFDKKKLTAAAKVFAAKRKDILAVVREKDHDLLKFTANHQARKVEFFLAAVDQRRLVLGYKPDVLSALDRAARKAAPLLRKRELVDRLTHMDATTVLSNFGPGSMLANPSGFTGFDFPEGKLLQGLAADPATAKLLKNVALLQFDIRISSGIKFLVNLEMSDLDAAKEIKPIIVKGGNQAKLLINLAIFQDSSLKPLGELTRTLTVSSKGKAIKLETSLSGKAIDDLVKAVGQKK